MFGEFRFGQPYFGQSGSIDTLSAGFTLHADVGVPLTVFMAVGDSGSGYVTATDVPTSDLSPSGGGTGLTLDITAVAGSITSVAIHTPGSGYQFGAQLEIDQLGSGFNAYVTVDSLSDVFVLSSANPFAPGGGIGIYRPRLLAESGSFTWSGTAAALIPSVTNVLGYLPETTTRISGLPRTTRSESLPTSTEKTLA